MSRVTFKNLSQQPPQNRDDVYFGLRLWLLCLLFICLFDLPLGFINWFIGCCDFARLADAEPRLLCFLPYSALQLSMAGLESEKI